MKKSLLFLSAALLSSNLSFAQAQLGLGVQEFIFNANATAAPITGTAYSIPSSANLITWITSFASAPGSQTTILECSNDNSIWATCDTTTAVAGEARTIFTAARFVRATESARSGGGAITVTVIAKNSSNPANASGNTFATLFSPIVYGGTTTTSTLTLAPTSGAGTTGADIIFGVGNAGATEAGRFLAAGNLRIPNNIFFQARNAAGAANVDLIRLSVSDIIEIGSGTTATNFAGSLTLTTSASGVNLGATGYSGWTGRTYTRSPANALLNVNNNNETVVSYQINAGTAAPTVTACGTGTPTAHSNNMAGQVTATGATVCTVTFGAPAWSFTPFCTATNGTGARALYITAASTTAFTVNGLTSGDVFTYTCGGGGI